MLIFDAMTSCLILQKCLTGDVTWAGRDVKMHCPPLRSEMSNPAYYDTDFHHLPWQTHMFRYNVSASSVLQRVSNVGTWLAWRRTTDRWRWTTLHWDQPVASVMHSLDLRVNGHGTLTRRNFTACMSGPLLIALICHSCSIQTQACSHAHHPQPVSPTSNDIYVHLW